MGCMGADSAIRGAGVGVGAGGGGVGVAAVPGVADGALKSMTMGWTSPVWHASPGRARRSAAQALRSFILVSRENVFPAFSA
jgi:hypothetical protein